MNLSEGKKVVLVTGGFGYIASHVIKLLISKNYVVLSIDNMSNSYYDNLIEGCVYFIGDFADVSLLTRIQIKYSIDVIMHFAGSISVSESVKNPHLYYENNTIKTTILLNWMKTYKINNFIFSSTAAVFGNSNEIPITETTSKVPINPYGQSKLNSENEIIKSGINYIIFRYFNVCGASEDLKIGYNPNKEFSHIIPIISETLLGYRPQLKIFGNDYDTKDGTAIRDYVHVEDLAIAHLLGMEYLLETKKSNDFNLGSESGFSLKEILDEVEKSLDKKVNYVFVERRSGDPSILVASNKKALDILKWKPTKTLSQMIISDFNWQLKNKKR